MIKVTQRFTPPRGSGIRAFSGTGAFFPQGVVHIRRRSSYDAEYLEKTMDKGLDAAVQEQLRKIRKGEEDVKSSRPS